MAVAVAPDALTEAIRALHTLRPRLTDDASARGQRWDAAAMIYAAAGRAGLIRAAQEAGYSLRTLQRWVQLSRVFPPAWRAQYPRVSEGTLLGILRVLQWFPSGQPERDVRCWLALADRHSWGRQGVIKAARARKATRPQDGPPSPLGAEAAAAFADGLRRWQMMAASPLSVADRGRLAAEMARHLEEAVTVFNQLWSPYYLERLTLTREPLV
ncbi:hypothetical protein Sulac_0672 [Sulfobacillus acidophilus DSM 10332]|uniref:Uncharacterized protein n=1 Tax=Sulfobacillus acidophilus (strain ATCC 700253 / DSM 10332 / NAL) TaxID=679936 RepID=G8U013_SULAD|nr:hypothetical protein Sulac_0672 [Sulfobacillus acidophilus DSM 10332]